MAVTEGAVSGNLAEVGAVAASAVHVTPKPLAQSAALGSYRIAVTSGTMAAALAAAAQIFYVRWTDDTRFFVLRKFIMRMQTLTPFAAAATDFGFDLFKATAVSAGGGGTDLGATAKTKMRTTMANSLLATAGDVRIATTAALTAITTLDALAIAQSIGEGQRTNPAAATEEARVNDPTLIYEVDLASGEYPLTLANEEGLVLRNRVVWPATGTIVFQIGMVWDEVSAL